MMQQPLQRLTQSNAMNAPPLDQTAIMVLARLPMVSALN